MKITINKRTPISRFKLFALASITLFLSGCSEPGNQSQTGDSTPGIVQAPASKEHNINIWPALDNPVKTDAELEQKILDIVNDMTLEQKVAQMIQPEIRNITVEDMRRYGFGSFLNGGGAFPQNNKHATPDDWIKLAEDMYQASIDDSLDGSTIPTMWGTDAVHGHNNVIGATLFPHNIGLGAANNPQLIEDIAKITATEVKVTGIDWVFAPTVAVVRDDRWGRTYEGYSEDPEIVRDYSAAIVRGLQGSVNDDFLGDDRVISTVKHFIGDGGTVGGVDQGDNVSSEQELFDIHAQGYVGGLTAGAQTVMASFNSWHGEKIHGNQYLLTDVLKDKMGFDGLVVGDWLGHGQIKGCSNDNCSQTINAGLDIYMASSDAWKPLMENTIAQVNSGEIPLTRINDAVSRILRVKLRAGIFDQPSPANRQFSGKLELIGAAEHRAVARQAVRESLVLLKNNDNILPLNPKQKFLLAGDAADNIGKQSGGWTVTWQGTGNSNEDFPGGTSIYSGFKNAIIDSGGSIELAADGNYTEIPDVAIVVFGEEPYAEGNGDIDNLDYQRGDKQDLALLNKLEAQGIPIVSVFISGRPMWVNSELNASSAFVAAWLPGSEGAGVSDVLLTNADGEIDHDFSGALSFSWPATSDQTVVNRFDENYQPLLPYGFGMQYGDDDILGDDLDESLSVASNGIEELAIFQRAVKAPWMMRVTSNDSSVFMTSNRLELESITVQSLDKEVQEDARTVSLKGDAKSTLTLASEFSKDLRSYLEQNASLSFILRVEDQPDSDIYLAMLCGDDCAGEINITEQINAIPVDSWQELNVDLRCFVDAGVNLSQVFAPFSISSDGSATFSISDILIKPNKAKTANISCSN